jgi:hypothetical protein
MSDTAQLSIISDFELRDYLKTCLSNLNLYSKNKTDISMLRTELSKLIIYEELQKNPPQNPNKFQKAFLDMNKDEINKNIHKEKLI